jgi:hypothetical protein
MTERPIIFNSEMVKAILEGRKTQTRRPIRPQPPHWRWDHNEFDERCINIASDDDKDGYYVICPFGKVGDRLWVRETWKKLPDGRIGYKASPDETCQYGNFILISNWKPSIHMPRWASRITLKITSVKVQRVQEITAEDCEFEGISGTTKSSPVNRLPYEEYNCGNGLVYGDPITAYLNLWNSIYDKTYPWESNPWVWAITLERTNL